MIQSGNFECGWPGNEIPSWFFHQSEGSSIFINLPSSLDEWYNSSYLGLATCVILDHDDYPIEASLYWNCVEYESFYKSPNGDFWSGGGYRNGDSRDDEKDYRVCKDCNRGDFESVSYRRAIGMNCEHVILSFIGRYGEFLNANEEKYKLVNENGLTSTATATAKASFFFKPYKGSVKVKRCGVHLLYTEEAEKFGFAIQHNEEQLQKKKVPILKNISHRETTSQS